MAINYELINKGGISLSTNFELLSDKPLDARQSVPTLEGLQNLIDNGAAYDGMVVYVSDQKTHYKIQLTEENTVLYRELNLTEAELKALIASETAGSFEDTSKAIDTLKDELTETIATSEQNAKTHSTSEILAAFAKFLSQENPPVSMENLTTLAEILANYATKQYVEDNKLDANFSVEEDTLILDLD
jgi:hypothetical protein